MKNIKTTDLNFERLKALDKVVLQQMLEGTKERLKSTENTYESHSKRIVDFFKYSTTIIGAIILFMINKKTDISISSANKAFDLVMFLGLIISISILLWNTYLHYMRDIAVFGKDVDTYTDDSINKMVQDEKYYTLKLMNQYHKSIQVNKAVNEDRRGHIQYMTIVSIALGLIFSISIGVIFLWAA